MSETKITALRCLKTSQGAKKHSIGFIVYRKFAKVFLGIKTHVLNLVQKQKISNF